MYLDYAELALDSTDGTFADHLELDRLSKVGIYAIQYQRSSSSPWPSTGVISVKSTHLSRPGLTILNDISLSTANWIKFPRGAVCRSTGSVFDSSTPAMFPIADHRLKVTLASSAGVYRGTLACFVGGE